MQNIFKIEKYGMSITFCIDEDNRLLILGISECETCETFTDNRCFTAVELHITGTNPQGSLGAKHVGESSPYTLKYVRHSQSDSGVDFILENELLRVKLHYVFYESARVVRSYCELENITNKSVGIEYISSFCLYGFDARTIMIPHSSWCRELNWHEYTLQELGYSPINSFSTKRINISNTGTLSTKEFLPMGCICNDNKTIMWQIENNGSWQWEISDTSDNLYLKLSGPTEQENGWWLNLKPNESYTTAAAAVCLVNGDFNTALAEMTKYRRCIAYKSPADLKLPVIFNDYMNCLWADPTEEKSIPVIDKAAEAGAECYCMDAGWYADGAWWETVGEWKVCEKRFPNGIKKVFDYIHSKGMLAGIWIEPESIGISCPILDEFDNNCFFMRHGERVIYNGRYHFDFRNNKVTDFLNNVIDGLIRDYGIDYFKFDYNIDGGVGTEIDADSFGDGLYKHNTAYLDWIDEIYKRHPNLIIENCSSGGMRMDYKTLSHFTIQSVSDQESFINTSVIAANVATAVLPEQAAIWSYPIAKNNENEVAFNMVSTMMLRMHLSGQITELDNNKFELIKNGIKCYKEVRKSIKTALPYYPCGISDYQSEWMCSGFLTDTKIYLKLWRRNADNEEYVVPINDDFERVKVLYPINSNCEYSLENGTLKVRLKSKYSAVLLEISK